MPQLITRQYTTLSPMKRMLKVSLFFTQGPNTGKYGPEKTPYLDIFDSSVSLNTGRNGPEKTPYLGTFHALQCLHYTTQRQLWRSVLSQQLSLYLSHSNCRVNFHIRLIKITLTVFFFRDVIDQNPVELCQMDLYTM